MLRKISVSVLALAIAGFAASAMAAPIVSVNSPLAGGNTASVPVNIVVDPVVSVWTSDSVELHLNGSGPNNATAAAGTLGMVSNVVADITASVSGSLPGPAFGGNGIQFFLFPNNSNAAAVVAGINSINGDPNPWGTNAYAPVGAVAWTPGDVAASATKLLFDNEPAHLGGTSLNIVYAADEPGGVQPVGNFNLTVTYTIAPAA
ncbi:MAG TPA: hypothetical protein VG757_10725 [Devosia sp.]|nr:hypothetical protein [Devosia sp.]